MNQNRNKDNDLQRAIDEITRKTAAPVANPAVTSTAATSKPAPVAPIPAAPAPKVDGMMPPAAPVAPVAAASGADAVETPEGVADEGAKPVDLPRAAAPVSEAPKAKTNNASSEVEKVKAAALKELFPIMSRIEVEPQKRFELYKEMLETMRDKAVIAPAYDAARQISNDTAKANALLYLINSIEDMNL